MAIPPQPTNDTRPAAGVSGPKQRSGRLHRVFALAGPGVLVAATGVGAGDLLTASFAGAELGMTLLWAAVIGAVLKWTLNEGIARWQLGSGTTLLEGWVRHLGKPVLLLFLVYLLIWSFSVGGALMNACGVAGASLFRFTDGPDALRHAKIIWGLAHSAVGLTLVWAGGYRIFEKLMAVCIAAMFVAVMVTAMWSDPEPAEIARGFIPLVPTGGGKWLFGVLGGVGGTVTLLSYGYWIRERGRRDAGELRNCRVDLAIGYAMTAMFGMAMIVIGSRLELGSGNRIATALADRLGATLGPADRWLFLAGFWGAVFSSLLGVWQSVPYLFADFVLCWRGVPSERREAIDLDRTTAYRVYLVALATVPAVLLWYDLRSVQLLYAVLGALFMPFLAATLLWLNNRRRWVGGELRNGWVINAILVATLVFFMVAGVRSVWMKMA